MSRRSMPDGVLSPDYAALALSADFKSEKTARKAAGRRTPKYASSNISGAPKPSKWDRERAALLAAVRRGDPEAVRKLRDEHHAWVIPGDAASLSPKET